MQIGFIGTGSMGSILIEAFIRSESVDAENIWASNRTRSKVEKLADTYPGLHIAQSNIETALESDILFLCVKPKEFKAVTDEISRVLLPSQIVVSITSPVLVRHLEDQLPCKVAKVIPSITNFAGSGASLCVFGERMQKDDRRVLNDLLNQVSRPIEVNENFTRITSDISSCGPAFLCFFVQKFIDAAVEEIGISETEATRLASEMVLGTGKLLTEGGFTPASLQKRVCVPGGITAEGIRSMSEKFEGMFNELVQATHAKYEEDLEKVESMYFGTRVD